MRESEGELLQLVWKKAMEVPYLALNDEVPHLDSCHMSVGSLEQTSRCLKVRF